MAKITDIRKLTIEDVDEKDRPLVEKLAGNDNSFKDDFALQFNGNIDFQNRIDKLITMELTVDGSGIPVGKNKFATGVNSVAGLTIVSATNLDDVSSSGYPTAQPWIIPKNLSQVIEIAKVTGLVANNKYRVRILVHSRT